MRLTKQLHTVGAIGAMTALLLATTGVSAGAKPLEREHWQDSFSEVDEEFCGDLNVRIDGDYRGSSLVNQRGSDRLAYFKTTIHGTLSYTNLENGKALTVVDNYIDKDQKVTDNGDGTLTILILLTGSSKWYGLDGKLLFNEPGQVRIEILVDHAGTPSDPYDDEFLEFLGVVKGSTGRNDTQGLDFCDDMIRPIIG